jgi:predicted metal-dependent hydrolase
VSSSTLTIDDLTFELRRSERRKTVGITVERNGELILTAPPDCSLVLIEQVARDKRFWIYTKLAEKELLCQPPPEREYVSGEGFYYLGRSYRLLLVEPDDSLPVLQLQQGRFRLQRSERAHAQQHFVTWYTTHGQPWIEQRVGALADRLAVIPGQVQVRDLGFRWGSCGKDGSLNFHWRTLLLPPRIIEYIAAHEMVHLHEPHHNEAFWRRLERAMPDMAARKQWLAENGARF